MQSPKPVKGPFGFANAPFWDRWLYCLYFVDIANSLVYGYKPFDDILSSAFGEQSTFIIPIEDNKLPVIGSFLINHKSNVVAMRWNIASEPFRIIGVFNQSYEENLNTASEAKISPSGAIFVGTYYFLHSVNF